MPDMPTPTNEGVFGITRITGLFVPRCDEINEVLLPAANVITSAPALIEPLISSNTAAMSCGLTTSSKTSLPLTLVARSQTQIP